MLSTDLQEIDIFQYFCRFVVVRMHFSINCTPLQIKYMPDMLYIYIYIFIYIYLYSMYLFLCLNGIFHNKNINGNYSLYFKGKYAIYSSK